MQGVLVLAGFPLPPPVRNAVEQRDDAHEGGHEREHDEASHHFLGLTSEIAKATTPAQMRNPATAVASENGRSLRKLPNIIAPPPTFAISRAVSANNVRCCGCNSSIGISRLHNVYRVGNSNESVLRPSELCGFCAVSPSALSHKPPTCCCSAIQSARSDMPLGPGARLGPYEVLSAIGAGGMGEVYRARDPKLNRDVALKILPATFALDADRRARFTREAQLLAILRVLRVFVVLVCSGDTSPRVS